jgi:thiol-disulfide isomerase/thioredoxin
VVEKKRIQFVPNKVDSLYVFGQPDRSCADSPVERHVESAAHLVHLSMKADTVLGPETFSGQSLKKKDNLAVLFAAEWCPFCRRFNPIFKSALAEKTMPGAIADLSDLDNPLWEIFDIQVVPTVMVFRNGELIFRKDGRLGQGLPDNAMNEVVTYLKTATKIID